LDFQHFWNWYWQNKAQLSVQAPSGAYELIQLWNWVMSFDLARAGIPAFFVVGILIGLTEAVMDLFQRPRSQPVSVNSRKEESGGQAPDLTGAQIKSELDRLGKTQSELAAQLGVTRAYVSQLIKGTKPLGPDLQQRCRQILRDWDVNR